MRFVSGLTSSVFGGYVRTRLKALQVWDVPRAEREIASVMDIARKYGRIDQIDTVMADKWEPGSNPLRIAAFPGESFVSFGITFNANEPYFRSWSGKHAHVRALWLLQAAFLSMAGRSIHSDGVNPANSFKVSASPDLTLSTIDVVARTHYVVALSVERAIRENFTTPDHSPLELADVRRSAGLHYARKAAAEIARAPQVVNRVVMPVTRGHTRDTMAAWSEVASLVNRVFYCLALDAAAPVEQSGEVLSKASLYRPVFAPTWNLLADQLKTLEAGAWEEACKPSPDVAASLTELFDRLGIGFRADTNTLSVIECHKPDWLINDQP